MRAYPLALALALFGCKTAPDDTTSPPLDEDGDGVTSDTDCDDHDASAWPGAPELCDGVDNDCDLSVDEGATDASDYYADADGDGYGDAGSIETACSPPAGHVADSGDCNDADPAYHPGAPETDCDDPNDYNCDGSVGFADEDGDGHPACSDCDDANAQAFPGGVELCDGADNDCEGTIDEGAVDAQTFYADVDADTYGDAATMTLACAGTPGLVSDASDCDDADAAVYPGAAETCDDIDQDCDGESRDPDATDAQTFFTDADADGHGDPLTSVLGCDPPPGAASVGDDCDDAQAAVHPGAAETCDDIDQDCDGDNRDPDATDAATFYADADGDGFGDPLSTATGCDAPTGFVTTADDCDDTDGAINPDAAEQCDLVDHDCDGDPSNGGGGGTWFDDTDGDGFGDDATSREACVQPVGTVAQGGDCDDANADAHPDGLEVCDSADNDCNGETDETSAWWDETFPYRIPVTVTASSKPVANPPVTLNVNFRIALDAVGDSAKFRPETMRVVLQDCSLAQPELPSQFVDGLVDLFEKGDSTHALGDEKGLVAFLYDTDGNYNTPAPFAANAEAEFAIYFGSDATSGSVPAPTYTTGLVADKARIKNNRGETLFDEARGGMLSSYTLQGSTTNLVRQADSLYGNGLYLGNWNADPQDGTGTLELVTAGPVLAVVRASGTRTSTATYAPGGYDYDFTYFRFASRPELYAKVLETTTRSSRMVHPTETIRGIRPWQVRLDEVAADATYTVDPGFMYANASGTAGSVAWAWVQPPEFIDTMQYANGYFYASANDYSGPVGTTQLVVPTGTAVVDNAIIMTYPHRLAWTAARNTVLGLQEGVTVVLGTAEGQ